MKRILLLFLAVLASLGNLWAGLYEPVSLILNNESGIYASGDTAVVLARTTKPGETVTLTVMENGVEIVCEDIELTGDYTEVFRQKCDGTKWVMAKIHSPRSNSTDYTAVGYVVDPQNFMPAYEMPEDLHEYWDGQVAAMRKKKMKVKVEKVETPEKYLGRVKCWHVTLSMHEGRPVNGYVAVPVGAMKKALPIVVCTHGAASITKSTCQSNLTTAINEAIMGTVAIDINAHGMEDGREAAYYKALNEEIGGYKTFPIVDRESYYFRLMYLRIIRAIDYMVKLPEWDGKRIMVSGGSQGGGQALAAAGIDPRVTHIRARVPALTDMGARYKDATSAWPFNTPKTRNDSRGDVADSVLPYFDASVLIRDYKGAIFMSVGFVDVTCPCPSVYAAYNNATTADKVMFAYPYRPHMSVDKRYKKNHDARETKVRKPFNMRFYYGQ